MNQAIKIIDEMIKETRACQTGKDFVKKEIQKAMISALQIARDKLSSLPSDTQWIDTLQRYKMSEYDIEFCGMYKAGD